MDDQAHLQHWFDRVETQLGKVKSIGGGVSVSRRHTSFVLDGEEFEITPSNDGIRGIGITFWLGINERRLFFISYINQDAEECKKHFEFCFGGAVKVGWQFSYEPLMDKMFAGCSVWGTCMMDEPVTCDKGDLTSGGRFWATDVAMMVQSMLRTAERHSIACLDLSPEPL